MCYYSELRQVGANIETQGEILALLKSRLKLPFTPLGPWSHPPSALCSEFLSWRPNPCKKNHSGTLWHLHLTPLTQQAMGLPAGISMKDWAFNLRLLHRGCCMSSIGRNTLFLFFPLTASSPFLWKNPWFLVILASLTLDSLSLFQENHSQKIHLVLNYLLEK